MQFSQRCLDRIHDFLCSYESWEPEEFKTAPTWPNRCFPTQVISLQTQTSVFFGTPCIRLFHTSNSHIITSLIMALWLADIRCSVASWHLPKAPEYQKSCQDVHLSSTSTNPSCWLAIWCQLLITRARKTVGKGIYISPKWQILGVFLKWANFYFFWRKKMFKDIKTFALRDHGW